MLQTVAIASVVALTFLAAPVRLESSAPPSSWVGIVADHAFTFYVPPGSDLKLLPGRPIDSFARRYAGATFRLAFDYGRWSNKLSDFVGDPRYRSTSALIDGRRALIVTGPGLGQWDCHDDLAAVYVIDHAEGRQPIALEMDACTRDPRQLETVQAIFRTIKFTSR